MNILQVLILQVQVLTLLLIPTSLPHPPEKHVNLLKSMQNPMKCNKHIY